MLISVDPESSQPPSRQIQDAVLDAIASGRLRPGDRLPSVRGLAAEAEVNANTVERAFRELQMLGVVEGRSGAGVFVTERGPVTARLLRRASTLEALQRAVAEALRAGHSPDSLDRRWRRWTGRDGQADPASVADDSLTR